MRERAAAIGTFDGMHKGHRSVIDVLTQYAREHGMEPVAITFDRHPLALIDPSRTPATLTPLAKKKRLLEEAGVTPIVFKFDDELRATTAHDWIERLNKEFNVKTLIVGYDNTFGSDGLNLSLEDYRRLGEEAGMTVLTAEEIKGVSSSAIRKAVASGHVEDALKMLGRPYSLQGKVVEGNKLGHSIGFPTANIKVEENRAVPALGVYAAEVKLPNEAKPLPAMVNIGKRPTVMRGDDVVIEAHIIGWKGDLYGKEISLRFLRRLRDEKKFDTIEALKAQLAKDRQDVTEAQDKE